MSIAINWTTVIASAVTAMVVGGCQFIANRYLARILDRVERSVAAESKKREERAREKCCCPPDTGND